MEKKYKKLNWSKERKELFNRMSDWLEEIRKGEKTGFVWSMEQLLVFIEQEIDRAREEQNKKIEDVINEELKQGNIVILKKSKWFKKLSKLKNKSNG